jgi:hypothetical protein
VLFITYPTAMSDRISAIRLNAAKITLFSVSFQVFMKVEATPLLCFCVNDSTNQSMDQVTQQGGAVYTCESCIEGAP